MTGANSNLNYLSYFLIDFQNSCAYHVVNFLNFLKLSQLLYFGRVAADKIAKNKVGPILWDTLYVIYSDIWNVYCKS